MARRASRTQAAEDEFTFAKNAFAERAGCGPRDAEPFHVLDLAATVADEVMMAHSARIEAGGAAFDGDFAHQSCLHEVAEIVVSGCARRARVEAIDSLKDFGGGGMAGVLHEKGHHAVALRSAAETGCLERPFDFVRFHVI